MRMNNMKTSIFILAFLFAGVCVADDFALQIKFLRKEFVQGEPIYASGTIQNVSGHEIKLALGCDDGFKTYFWSVRADGKPIPQIRDYVDCMPGMYSFQTVPPGWTDTKTENP